MKHNKGDKVPYTDDQIREIIDLAEACGLCLDNISSEGPFEVVFQDGKHVLYFFEFERTEDGRRILNDDGTLATEEASVRIPTGTKIPRFLISCDERVVYVSDARGNDVKVQFVVQSRCLDPESREPVGDGSFKEVEVTSKFEVAKNIADNAKKWQLSQGLVAEVRVVAREEYVG